MQAHPQHLKLQDLTPEQIAEVNTTMPGLHGCTLQQSGPGLTWLERLPPDTGVAIDLHPARTLEDAWNLARAIHTAATAPVTPAQA